MNSNGRRFAFEAREQFQLKLLAEAFLASTVRPIGELQSTESGDLFWKKEVFSVEIHSRRSDYTNRNLITTPLSWPSSSSGKALERFRVKLNLMIKFNQQLRAA